MQQQNETFPTWLEAVFLIVGLFMVEFLIGATVHDLKPLSGVDPRDIYGAIAVLGNGLLFSVLLHYKRMSYRSLFHASKNSIVATIATLTLPILAIIPALMLVVWTIDAVLVAIFPLSRWEAAMFEQMMAHGFVSFITVGIVAPVLEEMLFRGIILRSFLLQYARMPAIIGSAALFGLAHLNIYQFVAGFILGSVAGWLYERTRSLWPCILLHGAYNIIIVLLYFGLANSGSKEVWQPSFLFWVSAFVLAFFGVFLLQRLLIPSRASS